MRGQFDVTVNFNTATCEHAEILAVKLSTFLADDLEVLRYSVGAHDFNERWFKSEIIVMPFDEHYSTDDAELELCDKKRDEINSKINELIGELKHGGMRI